MELWSTTIILFRQRQLELSSDSFIVELIELPFGGTESLERSDKDVVEPKGNLRVIFRRLSLSLFELVHCPH